MKKPALFLLSAFLLAGCASAPKVALKDITWYYTNTKFASRVQADKYPADMKITEDTGKNNAITMLTNFTGKTISFLSISPDGERLAFHMCDTKDKDFRPQVYTIDTKTGHGLVKVTGSAVRAYDPSFSEDGREVYYCDELLGYPKIWSTSGDGKQVNLRQATTTRFPEVTPDVSRDGKKIAFTLIMPSSERTIICTSNRDGTELSFLRQGRSPKISPDGKYIAFVDYGEDGDSGGKTKTTQIWLMDMTGNSVRQITHNEGTCIDPCWSPNSRNIVYATDDQSQTDENDTKAVRDDFNIWMVNIDNPDTPIRLTSNPATDLSPAWSWDGKYIYFCSNRGLNWNIWRISLLEQMASMIKSPEGLKVSLERNVATVSWDAMNDDNVIGYNVYFRPANRKKPWKANDDIIKTNRFTVPDLTRGTDYFFSLTAVAKNLNTESASVKEVAARAVRPAAPAKPKAVVKEGMVTLSWKTLPESAGYNVYYRIGTSRNDWRLNENPVDSASYVVKDTFLKPDTPYVFSVASIDKNGDESEHSPGVSVKIETPKETAPQKAAVSQNTGWGSSGTQNSWGSTSTTNDWGNTAK